METSGQQLSETVASVPDSRWPTRPLGAEVGGHPGVSEEQTASASLKQARRIVSTFALWYAGALKAAAGSLVLGVCLLTFANLTRRGLGFGTFPWADESARRFLVWLAFLGAALAFLDGSHLSADVIASRQSPRMSRFFRALSSTVSVGLAGVLVWGGYAYAMSAHTQRTPGMSVSGAWTAAAAPAGGLLILVSIALRAAAQAREAASSPPKRRG